MTSCRYPFVRADAAACFPCAPEYFDLREIRFLFRVLFLEKQRKIQAPLSMRNGFHLQSAGYYYFIKEFLQP